MEDTHANSLFHDLDARQIEDKFIEFASSNDPSTIDFLVELLREKIRGVHPDVKHVLPRLAALALIRKGPVGLDRLISALPKAPGSIYPTSIIESLWHAANGSKGFMSGLIATQRSSWAVDMPSDIRLAARQALDKVIRESLANEGLFDCLIQFLWQEAKFGIIASGPEGARSFREYVFKAFAGAAIRLNESIIHELIELISAGLREEEYQRFFKRNPAMLDPLAGEVISKQKLGIDHVTDFVVKRLDDKYIMVEIEKPQDSIFTSSGDFSSKFSHALGQILDFQRWVDSNKAYADKLMPGVSNPTGLLVMGRASDFSHDDAAKLRQFNINSSTILILTYDDVVSQADTLLRNLLPR